MSDTRRSASEPRDDPAPEPRAMPVVESESLLRGEREVRIRHGDQFYRLIETRNGKLLLNKE